MYFCGFPCFRNGPVACLSFPRHIYIEIVLIQLPIARRQLIWQYATSLYRHHLRFIRGYQNNRNYCVIFQVMIVFGNLTNPNITTRIIQAKVRR